MCNYKKITLIAFLFLTGCATGQMQSKSNQSNAIESASSSLKNLYKPKNVIGRDLKGTITKELLLDYSTTTNLTIQEPQGVQKYCNVNGLVNVSNQATPLIDATAYNQAMSFGKNIVQKRAVWKFNVEQTNKAEQAVPMQRYEQSKAAREQKVKREDDAGYVTKSGRFDSRKLTKDIFSGLGLEQDTPLVARQKAEEKAYEEFKQDLAFNRNVLSTQNSNLLAEEQSYVNKLSSIYQNTLQNLTNMSPKSIPMQTLKQFSEFREKNIYQCIYERTAGNINLPKELLSDRNFINSSYEKYASNVILVGADDAIKKLNSSTTSAGIESEFNYIYPTNELKRVALNTPAIADTFKTRSNKLKLAENLAYEKEQRLLAAEAARQAKLKVKNNSSPSESDVQRAVLKASVEKTNSQLELSHTEITGINSYNRIANLLGYEFKATEMKIAVKNLHCRKEGRKQRCSYDEIFKETPYIFGAAIDMNSEKVVSRENTFYWTTEGLLAENGIDVSYYIPPPPSAYSSAGSGGDNGFKESYDEFMWQSYQKGKNYR